MTAKQSKVGESESDTQSNAARGAGATRRIPVVGLGGSAGALQALQEFLGATPADSGCAFIVVTHQHPDHKSLLPELLARATQMPVVEAHDGLALEPDHVYVTMPDSQLSLADGVLVVGDKPGRPHVGTAEQGYSTHASHHPIDTFFRALAVERHDLAIAVVLSGSGTDGSIGLKEIKAEAGLVLVQQPESAEFDGMPLAALRTNMVDHALPANELPERIIAHVRGSLRAQERDEQRDEVFETAKGAILTSIRERTGHDFSGYKHKTLQRRIQRRMDAVNVSDAGAYADYLRQHSDEVDTLFRELIVSVTRFFRDPEAWKALEATLQERIQSLSEEDELRAWVVGCATGEEAYTLAIIATECAAALGSNVPVHIFATDIEPSVIDVARTGEYPAGIEEDVPADLLNKYFVRLGDHYRVRKSLRERVVFAVHNVTQDPSFTRMDIVACRNLLIYMESDLQQKLMPLLHYALKPGGLLFLGASETVNRDRYDDFFEAVGRSAKIFRRTERSRSDQPLPQPPVRRTTPKRHEAQPDRERSLTFSRTVERLLLERYAPASTIVNDRGDASYFHGNTGRYLEPAAGLPGNNIVAMARDGLRPALLDALRTAAAAEDSDIVQRHTRVRTDAGLEDVLVQASRIDAPEPVRGLLLVSFQPSAEPEPSPPPKQGPSTESEDLRLARLEREYEAVAAEKRWTVEQLESTNQDLQSANEELQSANEELQSTNEELETSKEETESLNEELSAVNAELQEKIIALQQANNDLDNMLNSTEIAILFLSKDLEVRRFTEQVRELISLRESDIGRPLAELASNLRYEDLVEYAGIVLRTRQTREIDFHTKSGHWSRMRIMPYWTLDQQVDGLVCTFVGIDEAKRTEHQLAYFRSIVETVREPLVVLDPGLHVVSANGPFYTTFGLGSEQVEGESLFALAEGQWDHPDLRLLLEDILPRNRSLVDYEISADFQEAGHKRLLLNARQLERTLDQPGLILLAIEEIGAESPA